MATLDGTGGDYSGMKPTKGMTHFLGWALSIFAVGVAIFAGSSAYAAGAAQVYVALPQACRVLDTRVAQGGGGPLTQAGGPYLYAVTDAAISSVAQNGSVSGCGIPAGASAISAHVNITNTSASGDVRAWSDDLGPTIPIPGTAVYNPTVLTPMAGQVQYNEASPIIAVGADRGFYFYIANGQSDIVINATGYWLPLSAAAPTILTSSTSAAALTTLVGGLVGTQASMSISGPSTASVPTLGVGGLTLDLSSIAGVAQTFPVNATFSTFKGTLYTKLGATLLGSGNVTIKAELWTAPAGSSTATPTGFSCSANYGSGALSLLTFKASACTSAGSATVNAGDQGVIVLSSTTGGGLTLVSAFVVSTSLGISQ